MIFTFNTQINFYQHSFLFISEVFQLSLVSICLFILTVDTFETFLVITRLLLNNRF